MTDEHLSPEEVDREAANQAALIALMGTDPEPDDDTQQRNDNDALAALLGKQDTAA